MKPWLALSRTIDMLNGHLGGLLKWLILAAVIISGGNAILRKVVQHRLERLARSAVVPLRRGLHARRRLRVPEQRPCAHRLHLRPSCRRRRATGSTSSASSCFLAPLCLLLIKLSWPLFVNAWTTGEMSQNAGGLVRWPVMLLIPLGMALLLAQAISELIKRIAFLRGLIPDPLAHAAPGRARRGNRRTAGGPRNERLHRPAVRPAAVRGTVDLPADRLSGRVLAGGLRPAVRLHRHGGRDLSRRRCSRRCRCASSASCRTTRCSRSRSSR